MQHDEEELDKRNVVLTISESSSVSSTLNLRESISMAHLIGDNKIQNEELNYETIPAQSKDTKGSMQWEEMRKCVLLSVAYSANLGGTGTMIGTGANLILMGLLKEYFLNFKNLSKGA